MMKTTAAIILAITLVIIGIAGIYSIPAIKTKSYEREVEALAFSYRVYNSQVCPNRKILGDLRTEYEATVERSNVTKLAWIHENFDSHFMSTCLELNPHRGAY